MAVIKRKRKTNPYRVEVYVAGVRVATDSFPTRAAAHDWEERTKRRYEQGRGPIGELTLAEVINRYEASELKAKVGPTRKRRKGCFKFLTASPAAKVRMRDFDGGIVEQLLEWMVHHDRAKTVTRKSFLEELKTLRLVLGYYRDTYDAQFVVPITKRHRQRALFKGPVPKKSKDFFLPVDHARRWLAALASQHNQVFYGIAVTQVLLGLRIGEACAICDDAIDFDAKRLTVKRTMEWQTEDGKKCRRIVERVKTEESRRTLPLPDEVVAVLRQAFARDPAVVHRVDGKTVRVAFHMPSGELLHDETIRGAYTRAFEACGLPWTGTHICRDTNGTLALAGGSLEAVRVNHGHASVTETEGYAKVHAMIENRVPEVVARQLFPLPR